VVAVGSVTPIHLRQSAKASRQFASDALVGLRTENAANSICPYFFVSPFNHFQKGLTLFISLGTFVALQYPARSQKSPPGVRHGDRRRSNPSPETTVCMPASVSTMHVVWDSVAHIRGEKSHAIVQNALKILENLDHRGAVGADKLMGDGAGILIQIPDTLYREEMARPKACTLPPTAVNTAWA